MLIVKVPQVEYFSETNQEFLKVGGVDLRLEHSLVSLSKWESFWEKPFLDDGEKSQEEIKHYIKCMTLDDDVDPIVYSILSDDNVKQVADYIGAKMTATRFREEPNKTVGREIVTSEIIYYWMISLNIPFECQHWHLARLMTLIKVCNQKNTPPKKMSKSEIAARNRALNEQRRAQLKTTG